MQADVAYSSLFMMSWPRACLLLLLLVWPCSQSATAQTRPPVPPDDRPAEPVPEPADPMATARRPYTSLFGGAVVERQPSNGLRFTGAVFGVYDQNLLAEFLTPNTPAVSGGYTNLVGDLDYGRRTTRVQVAATGGANARYYTNLNKFAANDFHGGAGVSVRLDRLTSLTVNQAVTYAPVFLYGLFASALPPALGSVDSPNSAFFVNDDRAVTTDSSALFERRVTERNLISGSASYRRSHYTVVTSRGTDFTSVEGGGDYRYRLTQNSDLRLGYFYRKANFIGTEFFGGQVQRPAEHNLHLGVAYHPSLSEDRRTILTFEGGTSLVNSPVASNQFQARRQVRVVGDAAIARQMGASWLLVAAFRRGTGFVQGLGGPVFTDAVSLTSTGFFNRRTDLLASVAYSNGEPTLVGSIATFSTATANARLRVALTPRWAFVSEYLFYYYDFTKVLTLAGGLEPQVKRSTVRLGLTMWLPVGR